MSSALSSAFKNRWIRRLAIAAVFALVVLIALYFYVTNGGMIARQDPPSLEKLIAGKLVDISIPASAHESKNPLEAKPDSPAAFAGAELYKKNCEICHGFDGSGKTDAGAGLYPRPGDLRRAAAARRTDGDLFYLIRYGIRNTGMPGWQMQDEQIWQLVTAVRNLPRTTNAPGTVSQQSASPTAQFVGSASCRSCHTDIYDRWKSTLMANVVRDPKEHPDAIIPDLSKPNPLVKFTRDDVAFTYGAKWKQRYFKKVDGDYYPYPAQWDVIHKQWKPYTVKDDWWVKHYPGDNFTRPTSALCDGCHSVNYDIEKKTVTEWNVGCEKCHGPGSEHVAKASNFNILNPARMDTVAATDSCLQCHSQGQPLTNPIKGKHYDWPVGYSVGAKLSDFWKLEEHKAGENTFTHFGDGTAHKNRMQGNDYITSQMYTHGVACHTCHDSHGTQHDGLLRKPAQALCLDCHGPSSPSGPHAPSIEAHTHHKAGSTGSECIACHMPKIAQTLGDINVRSHTFRFVGPAKSDAFKIPNACNVCHTDKTTAWTADALKKWSDLSPWRMKQ